MRSTVVNHGVFQYGPQTLFRPFRGDVGLGGRLGQMPLQFLGAYDLAPWHGKPPGWGAGISSSTSLVPPAANVLGVPDDHRMSFQKIDSGEACIRFSWRPPYPPLGCTDLSGPPFNTVGQRVTRALWSNTAGPFPSADRTATNMPLFVCAADSLTELDCIWRAVVGLDWAAFGDQAGAPTVNQFAILGQFPQSTLTIGPDILTDLAQGCTAEYDLKELSGGARFVAAWAGFTWVGSDPNFAVAPSRTPLFFRWQVEDRSAMLRAAPVTYAFPIETIQPMSGQPTVPYQFPWICAQWASRFHNQGVVSQPIWSVSVANGGQALNVNIGHAVGTQIDETAAVNTPVPAVPAGNRFCQIVRIPQAPAAEFPYSYGFAAIETGAPVAGSGPVIVNVTVS